jgi:phosphoglycolate phosphatase-like HAD superfamily hydrolase
MSLLFFPQSRTARFAPAAFPFARAMNLIVFDIDGTLTQTSHVDELCYTRAWTELHGVADIREYWLGCPHVSDAGVTEHVFQQLFGRLPQERETDALRTRLVNLLEAHFAAEPSFFAEIPGAARTFNQHVDGSGWVKALATGCWQPSARMKLRAAGVRHAGVPGGFSEDGAARETIVTAAIERAQQHYGVRRFDRIVSVGDGLWDVRTAANLGLPFVGVAANERAESLRQAGATHVLAHYEDVNRFFAYLDAAETPVA